MGRNAVWSVAAVAIALALAGQQAGATRNPWQSSISLWHSRSLLTGIETEDPDPNACVLSGETTPVTPGRPGPVETCVDQAACISVYYSGDCNTTAEEGTGIVYHYCKVCLYWSNATNCPKSTSDSISHVCAADRFLGAIHVPGEPPATGEGSTGKVNDWNDGINERFCQYVRFNATDQFQHVYFTVKDGPNADVCLPANETSLNVTINGVDASCQRPRRLPNNTLAGCAQGNQDNECLWEFRVPKPGTPGFPCNNKPPSPPKPCPPKPPSPPPPRPPRPPRRPYQARPPNPPRPPRPPPSPPKPPRPPRYPEECK